jgi:7-cyano-7-deazaguanine reductase
VPNKLCLELKSLKMYTLAYRNLGIFQENVVNRVLRDVVAACRPMEATVTGEFTPRGGVYTTITASWNKKSSRSRNGSKR